MRRIHPDHEVLAALVLDDADATSEQRQHLVGCDRCRAEVDELRRVLGHASSADPRATLESPGAQVWTAVEERITPGAAHALGQVSRSHPDRPPRGRRAGVILLAAACLVVGGVVGRSSAPPTVEEPPGTAEVQVASAELDTLDGDQQLGTATVSRTGARTDLMLSLTGGDAGSGYLEVWLIHRDLEQMVSVGVVGDTWSPSFTIPQQLLDEGYVVVDVSRESFGGGPEHSGDSLMRGTLDTASG